MKVPRPTLLLAGGILDPNLESVARAAGALGIDLVDLRFGPSLNPRFSWDPSRAPARVDGVPRLPDAAFIRYDVFGALADSREAVRQRSIGWLHAVQGWLHANSSVRTFNREASNASTYKPAELAAARRAGLAIPRTLVSNEACSLEEFAGGIVKPVAGGDYCRPLEEVGQSTEFRQGASSTPAIVQRRMVAPEVRVFVIGSRQFAFEMQSPSLDYRIKQDAKVLPCAPPPESAGLIALMREFRMEFGAADFKTDPETGKLAFLELNSSPMFAAFDQTTEGELSRALVRELLALPAVN
jgi:hypothetical protein